MVAVVVDENNMTSLVHLQGKSSSAFYPSKHKETFDDLETRKKYLHGKMQWLNHFLLLHIFYLFTFLQVKLHNIFEKRNVVRVK